MSAERLTARKVFSLLSHPRNKYNVGNDPAGKAARTYNGVLYDSVAEANYAAELDLCKKIGTICQVERQKRFSLYVAGNKICDYIADFHVKFADGHYEAHEIKGYSTEVWKLKAKLFRVLYPEIKLVVIKK